MFKQTVTSPLGPLTLLGDETALCGVWFDQQRYYGAGFDLDAATTQATPALTAAAEWVTAYFAGTQPEPKRVPLHMAGTPFRQRVWQALQAVPYGHTITYGELAVALGSPLKAKTLARAVGGAVGHNPLSLIVPCHRVVGADGSLTGYAGGLARKQALLRLEGVALLK